MSSGLVLIGLFSSCDSLLMCISRAVSGDDRLSVLPWRPNKVSSMPLIVDFVLPSRPCSYQTKNASHRRVWNDYIYGRARLAWPARPLVNYPLKFTMVYLYEGARPGDINNFVKPVQDALRTLIYADDSMIRDMSAHMRVVDVNGAKDVCLQSWQMLSIQGRSAFMWRFPTRANLPRR